MSEKTTLPRIEKGKRNSPDKSDKSSPIDKKHDLELFLNNTQQSAGVPIFELIRKMEEENILTREDRLALHTGLYDPDRREAIVKAVQDVELSMNSKFALKRLKILLHQNPGGKPSGNSHSTNAPIDSILSIPLQSLNLLKSSATNNNHFNDVIGNERVDDAIDTLTKLKTVLGDENISYGDFNRANASNSCSKISRNYSLYRQANPANGQNAKWQSRKFAVVVGSGSFNPLTRMHLRTFYIAKQCLEKSTEYVILGSLLSPAHQSLVRERYRTCPLEAIPAPHRLAISQLAVEESKWMSIDPWEITRRRAMDYLSLLEHVTTMLGECMSLESEIRVLLLCKANQVPKLSPNALRKSNFGVVCVCRPPESDMLIESLGSRWKGLLYVAEDTAIVDASMDTVSSRRVRDKLKAGEPVDQLVGDAVGAYFRAHRIGPKMAGADPWDETDRRMPKIAAGARSEPAIPVSHQPSVSSDTTAAAASTSAAPDGVSEGTTGTISDLAPRARPRSLPLLTPISMHGPKRKYP